MNVLVVGVDGSPASVKAVNWIGRRGGDRPQRVVVVAAVDPGMAAADSELARLEREKANGHVRSATASLAGLGATVEGRVVDGDPRKVLVEIARDEKAELLVLGSHGKNAIERLLLGSVAAHLVNHAPCNVLIVRLAD